MKRQAKRIYSPLTAEKQADLRRLRATIDREEKPEILAKARAIRKRNTLK